jgi:hypothetical protein
VGPLKDLSAGLARFVYAWLVPSATAVAVFVAFVLPDLSGTVRRFDVGSTGSLAVIGSAVLILGVVFAYGALPIYRVLEGYVMPAPLKRRLRKRQLREWYRLKAKAHVGPRLGPEYGLAMERLELYPARAADVLPTRLGNAMLATESYGDELFGLDSQTLWYELQSVAAPQLRADIEDAQAGIDVFMSALVHLCLLAIGAAGVAAITGGVSSVVVAVVSLALAPIAYNQAVRNAEEYRSSVQALVNTSREPVAIALGLRLPHTFAAERELWETYIELVQHGPDPANFQFLDDYRARPGSDQHDTDGK